MTVYISLTVVACVLTVFFLVVRVTQKPVYGLLTKTLASLGFLALGTGGLVVQNGLLPDGLALIPLGLAFGLVGDIVLDLKRAHSEYEGLYLTSGMVSFGIGHIVYFLALVLLATPYVGDLLIPALISLGIAAVVITVMMVVSIKLMHAKYGKHLVLGIVYGFILSFMTVFSIYIAILDRGFLLFGLGMAFFLISDIILNTMYFVEGQKENKLYCILNHATYYAAQILIASFVYLI